MKYRAEVVSSSIFAVCVLLAQPISAYAQAAAGGTSGDSTGTSSAASGTSAGTSTAGATAGVSTATAGMSPAGRSGTSSASTGATPTQSVSREGFGPPGNAAGDYYVTCSATSCDQLTQSPVSSAETPVAKPLSRRSRHYYIRPLAPDALAAQGGTAHPVESATPRISWYRGKASSSRRRFVRHDFANASALPVRRLAHGEPTSSGRELHDAVPPATPKIAMPPINLVDTVPKSDLDPAIKMPAQSPLSTRQLSKGELNLAVRALADPLSDNAHQSPEPARNPIASFPNPATYESDPANRAPAATPGPAARSDLPAPLVIGEKDVDAIHDCAGRDVTISASNSKLFLSGICHSVTIRGNKDNILVEISNTGRLMILGDHNAVIWSSGSDGPDPVVVSSDDSNTIIHLRSKSDVGAPLVTMEATRLASGPSLNQ
jgi:hypothetical protein